MKPSARHLFLILAFGPFLPLASAAPPREEAPSAGPSTGASTAAATGATTPMKTEKPIRMHEPMTTRMARPGMTKQDMHDGLMQKEAAMKDRMDEEERDMK